MGRCSTKNHAPRQRCRGLTPEHKLGGSTVSAVAANDQRGGDEAHRVQPIIDALRARNITIKAVRPIRESLEDLFMKAITDPTTGAVHKSVLKPVGQSYTNQTVDTDKGIVSTVTIEPANDQEIADTTAVMGGEDWEMWMQALSEAKLLAPGAQSVAYSYIGPEVTWAIYKNGTIGLAKNDLERAARSIDSLLKLQHSGGRACIAVNKALVTQASSAIPVVPLYIAILYTIMKAKGTHEGCIEQMARLFATQLYAPTGPQFDAGGRIRVDDWEMREEVQAAVKEIWPKVTTENLTELTDIAGYRSEFMKLFGFGLPGINYDADAEPHVPMI